MTQVVPFQGEPEELPASRARAFLERQALPSPSRIKQTARWYAFEGSKGALALAVQAPVLLLRELYPIAVGLGRIVSGWSRWMSATKLDAGLSAAESKTEKGPLSLESQKSNRRKLSLVMFLTLIGVGLWTWFHYPLALLLAGGLFVVACDAVGRASTEKVSVSLPSPMRTVLKEGVPLSQVTEAILNTLAAEGFTVDGPDRRVGVARPLRYDAARQEYRMQLSLLDELKPEHLRAIERGIGASDYSVRPLATGIATVRELVIRDGDPLALDRIGPPSWIPTGSVSVEEDALDLGESMTEVPFALDFAGVHMRVVAGTGGGKTAWFLRNTIDRLSACRDVVLWGVDLTAGPELPLWRGVIQKRAFTPEDADELLDAALVEIDRRAKILASFAEDDDPANDDITEWCSQLGPWLVIVIDEFSTLAEYDGKGGRLDLLGKAKQVIRTGRKHGVSEVMFAQRTGNEDFGSSVMSTQAGTAIVGPCDMTDTINVFGKERRDAGYAPHLLTPGTKDSPNDAGKCFIDSARHRTADLYRAYLPLSAGEVKRRARQRIADDLPSLTVAAPRADEDAAVVPEALLIMEELFAKYDADRVPTEMVLEFAGDDWTDMSLADALRPHGVTSHKARNEFTPGKSVMCYYRAEVQAALGAL